MGVTREAIERADEGDFRARAEPHRRALLAHCYRMSGSLHEAEELVQETMLKAWRNRESFEGRSSLRTWLFRIATNVTLDALKRPSAKARRLTRGEPCAPDAPLPPPITEPVWLEPYPDSLLPDEAPAPDARLSQQQSIGLAFLQALQRLPPTQRAALLLKDVVGSSSAEVAELLDSSAAAINSMLQRARATLGQAPPPEPADEAQLECVRAYMQAFESANVTSLVSLLQDEARLSMPPIPAWYRGRETIGAWLRQTILRPQDAGRFLPRLTACNGRPALAMYERRDDGTRGLVGVQVLEIAEGRIAELVSFMDPSTLKSFDLPPVLEP